MVSNKCFNCVNEFKRNEKVIICFVCKGEYHAKCTGINGISEEKIKAILDIIRFKYVCFHCEGNNLVQQIGELKNHLDEQSEIMNKMNKTLEYLMNSDNVNKNKSYSDILKKNNSEVIVVKPKNANQECKQTQKDVKTKIDPSKIAVGVESIKNVSKGGIVINCTNNDSKEKLKDTVKKELGNKYQVIEPKLKNPKLIVLGTENETIKEENDIILNKIVKQNGLEALDDKIVDKLKIESKFTRKLRGNQGNIVLDVEADIYERILNMAKLNIGWRKCDVREYFNIIRCFKCKGYGHFSGKCTNRETCGKCSGEHKTKDCNSEEIKCINCFKTKEKLNIDIDFGHTVFDVNCTCYKRVLEKIKSKIRYK